MITTSTRFASYIRVSTQQQGRSGLGLEAQQVEVERYVRGKGGEIAREFREVETATGKRRRPVLAEALHYCQTTGAVLVVAKVDRLVRSVSFLTTIQSTAVEVAFADLPQLEGPQGRFLLNQFAAVAELEAGMISQRTRAALAAAKARGVKLGGPLGAKPLLDYGRGHELGTVAAKAKADEHSARLAPIVQEIRPGRSLRQIAAELNARGVRTPRGIGVWSASTVARLLARVDRPA
ncbi:MAG: hypothetical protein RJA59_1549 [Pseudomonadota bacterium]|jgi:DNA invertase Pin-like site-specific DNA recombinase